MELAKGVKTIKQIDSDYFYMLINIEKFTKWLKDNQTTTDGYIDLNLIRNNSEYFYMKKSDIRKKGVENENNCF